MDSLERLEIARKVRADEALRQPFLGDDRSFNAATPEPTVRSQNNVGSISRSHSANEIDRKCFFLFYRVYLRSNLGTR